MKPTRPNPRSSSASWIISGSGRRSLARLRTPATGGQSRFNPAVDEERSETCLLGMCRLSRQKRPGAPISARRGPPLPHDAAGPPQARQMSFQASGKRATGEPEKAGSYPFSFLPGSCHHGALF